MLKQNSIFFAFNQNPIWCTVRWQIWRTLSDFFEDTSTPMEGRSQRVFPARGYIQLEAIDKGWKFNIFPCKPFTEGWLTKGYLFDDTAQK